VLSHRRLYLRQRLLERHPTNSDLQRAGRPPCLACLQADNLKRLAAAFLTLLLRWIAPEPVRSIQIAMECRL